MSLQHFDPDQTCRYFDILPEELIVEIVDHLDSYPDDDVGYRARQRTFLSLCLTSQALRRISHPYLLAELLFHEGPGREKIKALVRWNPLPIPSQIRRIWILDEGKSIENDEAALQCYEELACAVPHLTALVCTGSLLPLNAFQNSNIKALTLDANPPTNPIRLPFFPKVERMLLMGDPGFVQCPDEQLPSIKHLALHMVDSFRTIFHDALLSRLDSITAGPYEAEASTKINHECGFTQVLDCFSPFDDTEALENAPMTSVLRLSDPRHVLPASEEQIMAMNSLRYLDYYIRSASLTPRLEAIILPASYAYANLPRRTRQLVSDLVGICRFRGIKVIFENHDRKVDPWRSISPAVIRLAEMKAEVAREGNVG